MKPFYIVRHTTGSKVFTERIAFLIQEQLPEVDVRIVSAQRQKAQMKQVQGKIINLDPFTRLPGHKTLDVCRVFNPGVQTQCVSHDARPNASPLYAQLLNIPPGEYHLVDDDISTGSTMNFVEGLLIVENIKIISRISVLNISLQEFGLFDVYDVVDSHDFANPKDRSPQSGLVMNLNNRLQRMTYINPMVNLQTRARLPDPERFVKQMKGDLLFEVTQAFAHKEGLWL